MRFKLLRGADRHTKVEFKPQLLDFYLVQDDAHVVKYEAGVQVHAIGSEDLSTFTKNVV